MLIHNQSLFILQAVQMYNANVKIENGGVKSC